MKIQVLWAVSSVGKGHIMRDIAIVKQLSALANVRIDWLIPDPAREFMISKGYQVLNLSAQLLGSGKVYKQIFENRTDEFNLLNYTQIDTKLHKNDFLISAQAWENTDYDVIVGDEAFWLLTGFASHWKPKPAPFIFITDFIGTKAIRFRIKDKFIAWYNNFRFTMSHLGTDKYLYIGNVKEIPDESLGIILPKRRSWAERHCQFVKPIVNFDLANIPDKLTLRKKLGLPEKSKVFLAIIGEQGNYSHRIAIIEEVFEFLKTDFSKAHFILVCPERCTKNWIQYEQYLNNLYEYFAASDFVITESGYGKVIELSALGTPFIAIPLEYHFEQEYVMGHRLSFYGIGKLTPLRNYSSQAIATFVYQLMEKSIPRLEVDNGMEVAKIILEIANRNSK